MSDPGFTYRKTAFLDASRTYRYWLLRSWGSSSTNKKGLVVIGLNPSTADEQEDDPTIRRCVGFAKREGCDSLLMLNLFAYRATVPESLWAAPVDTVGSSNDTFLASKSRVFALQSVVVAAWGAAKPARARAEVVTQMFKKLGVPLLCFGTTKDGAPRHPLYLRRDTALVPYQSQEA